MSLWEGLSAYRTLAQARRKARGVPFLGQYIAELDVPDDGSVRYERTTTSSGHFTLWGDAGVLVTKVVRVVPVNPSTPS